MNGWASIFPIDNHLTSVDGEDGEYIIKPFLLKVLQPFENWA